MTQQPLAEVLRALTLRGCLSLTIATGISVTLTWTLLSI